MRKKLIAGNWKMNGLTSYMDDLARPLAEAMKNETCCEMLICPPFHLMDRAVQLAKDSNLLVGAQDCHTEVNGAHTGNISAEMIKDMGATHVIVGHSERRADNGETNAIVSAKAKAGHEAGLISIICFGETEEERDAGRAAEVVCKQLEESIPEGSIANNTVLAYEPVWAIGTGKTASAQDVEDMHKVIREKISTIISDFDDVRVLYGGSVKPDNAKEILNTDNVDGALVGGAALKAESFIGIANGASSNCTCQPS